MAEYKLKFARQPYLVAAGVTTPGKKAPHHSYGGKGASLVKMVQAGMRVPPAVIIPVEVGVQWRKAFGAKVWRNAVVRRALRKLSGKGGVNLDNTLFSVRSGAPMSMPGMMDTVLNVGIHSGNLQHFSEVLGHGVAMDCYVRLLVQFAKVVRGLELDTDQPLENLEQAARLPKTLKEQLEACVEAVWLSWFSERAVSYRKHYNITPDQCKFTACIIQSMVFGNKDDRSCSGVLFTRCPDTGADRLVGEVVFGGQGEDVVSGSRTPDPIEVLADRLPITWARLVEAAKRLEAMHNDMMDIEFTVQSGVLYILQCRKGKRSPAADEVLSKAFGKRQTPKVSRVHEIVQVMMDKKGVNMEVSHISADDLSNKMTPGVGACAGVGVGYLRTMEDVSWPPDRPYILLAEQTDPSMFTMMKGAAGVLTEVGGITSHAAVVCRSLGIPCVVGMSGAYALRLSAWHTKVVLDGTTGKLHYWNFVTLKEKHKSEDPVLSKVVKALSGGKYRLRCRHPALLSEKRISSISVGALLAYDPKGVPLGYSTLVEMHSPIRGLDDFFTCKPTGYVETDPLLDRRAHVYDGVATDSICEIWEVLKLETDQLNDSIGGG